MQNNGKNPLVSIISPCFNGEYFVSRFLNSILQQSYDNIEVIVIDDGSTDDTANVINSYKDKFLERNFTLNYIYQEHAGQSAAINQGLKIFNGDYMTWFDSDDFMTPDSIEKRVNFLEENPQYDFCICQLAWVPEDDLTNITYVQKRIPPPPGEADTLFEDMLLERNHIFPNVYLTKREAFLRANPKRYIYPSTEGQNWQLILPLAYHCKCGYINEPLAFYVERKSSHSHINRTVRELAIRNDNFIILLTHTIKELNIPNESDILKFINVKFKHRNLVLGIQNNDEKIIQESCQFAIQNKLNIFQSENFDMVSLLNNYILPTNEIRKSLNSILPYFGKKRPIFCGDKVFADKVKNIFHLNDDEYIILNDDSNVIHLDRLINIIHKYAIHLFFTIAYEQLKPYLEDMGLKEDEDFFNGINLIRFL